MLKFLRKKIQQFKDEQKKQLVFRTLMDKNNDFLSKLSIDEHKKLFLHLKDYAIIKYSIEPFQHPELSDFFNDFFSIYDSIEIDEKKCETYKISKDYIYLDAYENRYLPNILSIGKDMSDWIYIKKNDPLNHIYIETLDLEQSINSDSPLYSNIYQFLIDHIGSEYNLDLEKIWNEIKQ
jgi:hypothetical protein